MAIVSAASGRLSDLVLVRMHRRTAEYLGGDDAARAEVAAACRGEATVGDLAERILVRTIYAQASSRVGPLRELLQNALDVTPRGARIDVRSGAPVAGGDRELTFTDRGRGMSRAELLEDLLVPFRSGKEAEPDAIGEHGIGFLSALEIAPRVEVVTCALRRNPTSPADLRCALRLRIEPLGDGPPYPDFTFTLEEIPAPPSTGTSVRLLLERPIAPAALAQELAAAAGLVDPGVARIFVNDVVVNAARAHLRRVARVSIGEGLGDLDLLVGRGEGVAPRFVLVQKGLLVSASGEVFGAPELSLHRDLLRAITTAGYGVVADLPLAVPLTKGRSAVAAVAARAAATAVAAAFERFVLEDALYDRELLRGVDHRLSAVLDRLVNAALTGDGAPAARGETGVAAELAGVQAPRASTPPPSNDAARPRGPTVAAPEEVVRFAGALLDAPMFVLSSFEPGIGEVRSARTLRAVVQAYRAGLLRASGGERGASRADRRPGVLYLAASDPLAQALFRRLAVQGAPLASPAAQPSSARPMQRVARDRLLAAEVPGVAALAAAVAVLERIDSAISAAAGISPSVLSVHQDLYGPDEMAHTDGTGISVNLASPRIRALLTAVLVADDAAAFGALVDLLLHEKAHVALASYVPRSSAEHGATFYRRKDLLRRRLLEVIAAGDIPDPIRWLSVARHGLASVELPSTEDLAAAFGSEPLAA
jgi:hypothetical protein